MKSRLLLQTVDFGDDVAEFDEQLAKSFVKTSSFMDIVSDKADLILGEKGSGKSAIFRHLADPDAEIGELDDVDVVPAFNVRGSVIFRRLSEGVILPDEAYRFIWFTFIVGIIANHILSAYSEILDLNPLADLLQRADLRVGPPFAPNVWERIQALIASISSRLELEGELELGIPKLPIKARTRGLLRSRTTTFGSEVEQVDLEEVLYKCDDYLTLLDRRCWLLFDRLDEAFDHNHDLESRALRGLLRAHLDLASYGSRLRTKLFLRSDILDRITGSGGFVNATHLRRHRLQWDRESIIDLIARRIAASSAESLGIDSSILRTDVGRRFVCYSVLPRQINKQDLISWIVVNSVDASEALNPRNVIGLLRFARKHQLVDYDRADPDFTNKPLIFSNAMQQGFEDLSEARLEDTVLAEFYVLRPVIEAMRKKPTRMSIRELAGYMQTSPRSEEFRTLLKTLEYAGVVSANRGIITVARLYRPALQVNIARAAGVGAIEVRELRALVDDAVERLRSGESRVLIRKLDNQQRKEIYEYIKVHHTDLKTRSMRSDRFEWKDLLIERDFRVADKLTQSTFSLGHLNLLNKLYEEASASDSLIISSPVSASDVAIMRRYDRSHPHSSKAFIVAVVSPWPSPEKMDGTYERIVLGNYPPSLFYKPARRRPRVAQYVPELIDLVNRVCDLVIAEQCAAEVQLSMGRLLEVVGEVTAKRIGVALPIVDGEVNQYRSCMVKLVPDAAL